MTMKFTLKGQTFSMVKNWKGRLVPFVKGRGEEGYITLSHYEKALKEYRRQTSGGRGRKKTTRKARPRSKTVRGNTHAKNQQMFEGLLKKAYLFETASKKNVRNSDVERAIRKKWLSPKQGAALNDMLGAGFYIPKKRKSRTSRDYMGEEASPGDTSYIRRLSTRTELARLSGNRRSERRWGEELEHFIEHVSDDAREAALWRAISDEAKQKVRNRWGL